MSWLVIILIIVSNIWIKALLRREVDKENEEKTE